MEHLGILVEDAADAVSAIFPHDAQVLRLDEALDRRAEVAQMGAGTHLAVIEVALRYLKPARYEDELTVRTRCTESSGTRVTLAYEVLRGGELLATGTTRLASIEPGGKPKRMPEELRAAFEAAVRAEGGAA